MPILTMQEHSYGRCGRTEGGLWQFPNAWEFFTSRQTCFGANTIADGLPGDTQPGWLEDKKAIFGSGWDRRDAGAENILKQSGMPAGMPARPARSM